MAKGKDKAEGDKPKGGVLKIALGGVALVAVGAGGAYGAFAAGLFGGGAKEGPDVPGFVAKGEADPYAPAGGKGKDEGPVVYGEGGSEYRTAYYSFEDSFTSNLADSPALIQVDLAVSTRRDGRVLQWVANHELAIRSAILVQLAATPEADVYAVDGKEKLAQRLTRAINEVLEENEGFGGIENVHFKGFLVQ
ncbi:flagellar basal body-associated FliL family protein [Erythrobacter sp. HL-111]|uniref:flagellar basal body-associated FliL family protein n=1 Tax=Erythrobacter sp. HL-111 TaxID=1798193 RepID=UPI0006DB021A|nr:flagellar basal body-associated FliL family protein [Erythrobacter sp. HL-111]KPP92584.1 MAG: flagellar basal body-associated protein FliL [Erythrobacteraceae bacterium HL-111]SDS93137.1 flagellar FliL protein [Erythrobacter sp. HL-111]